MRKKKLAKRAAKGWKVGSAAEFLRLTPEEAAQVEARLGPAQSPRAPRRKAAAFAGRLRSAEGDISVHHDDYLAEAYASSRTRRKQPRKPHSPT